MKKQMITALLLGMALLPASAQQIAKDGGISPQMMEQIKKSYNQNNPIDRALRNAVSNNSLKSLALNQENMKEMDTHFSVEVKSKGITNQLSSGRCWLFTGLNAMRQEAIAKYNMPSFEFSQVYSFFFDQLEKSNLFLQAIIDTATKPMDDKTVEWLFKHPLSDGGTFTGVADVVNKYGLVPKSAMPETFQSNNTDRISRLMGLRLKEDGLKLRKMIAEKKSRKDVLAAKTNMLAEMYRILVLGFGVPPTEFDYQVKDDKGNIIATEHHTPMSFYEKYGDKELMTDYVMLMNDPSRPYYKTYQISYDRHRYDGHDWFYVNLPIEDIKKMAIASLKANESMYFSCDVGKHANSARGLLDINNYDYSDLLGVEFGMDKKERIETFSSGSSHAMTLMAVDINKEGKTTKWMVENSWGPTNGYKGHLIMTDEWFNEYMFRLVVKTKFVPENIKKIVNTKPIMLPAWDPMFSPEQ